MRMPLVLALAALALLGSAASCHSGRRASPQKARESVREEPFTRRPLVLTRGEQWVGDGIAYGPHRDRQRPGGPSPSPAQIAEDLRILAGHWHWIRIYGSVELGETILRTIQAEKLDLHVLLGAWVAPETGPPDTTGTVPHFPAVQAQNRAEIDAAVRLANAYPAIVTAVCVGNETQIFWSAHRSAPDVLIGYLRDARARTHLPVTTADDYNFWNKPESDAVARECDFIVMHAHPLWNGLQLETALDWTQATLADVQAKHPGVPVVLGETGWATQRNDQGDQGKLMKGRLGEPEQAVFHRAFRAWVQEARVPSFFFEAFDENWKGGADPDEVEKHWGLYRADRTPKAAITELGPGR